jgi:hypothetical protein
MLVHGVMIMLGTSGRGVLRRTGPRKLHRRASAKSCATRHKRYGDDADQNMTREVPHRSMLAGQGDPRQQIVGLPHRRARSMHSLVNFQHLMG